MGASKLKASETPIPKLVKVKKPRLPSQIPIEELPYYATASQSVVPKAKKLVDLKGVHPITYKWEALSDEQRNAVLKVWKLEAAHAGGGKDPALRGMGPLRL